MPVTVVRLGSPRHGGEGLRLGTVRRPPRGVKKSEYASLDYYDVWVPELAPSADLLAWAMAGAWTEGRWKTFERRYRAEMRGPSTRRLLELLTALSGTANFSVGCYCEDGTRCHRRVLARLFEEAGAKVTAV